MKTAMQELIERLEDEDINVPYLIKSVYLEKEKEQIKDAYNDGYFGDSYKYKDWEDYYNQTYNQNK